MRRALAAAIGIALAAPLVAFGVVRSYAAMTDGQKFAQIEKGRYLATLAEKEKVSALAIVHTESSLGWGGQELRILAEAQGLARRGHALTLLCPPEARVYAEAPAWGLRTVALPIAKSMLATEL